MRQFQNRGWGGTAVYLPGNCSSYWEATLALVPCTADSLFDWNYKGIVWENRGLCSLAPSAWVGWLAASSPLPSPRIAPLMDGIWVPSKFSLPHGFELCVTYSTCAWRLPSRDCAFRHFRTAGKGVQMFRACQDQQWCWTRQLTSTEQEGPSLSFWQSGQVARSKLETWHYPTIQCWPLTSVLSQSCKPRKAVLGQRHPVATVSAMANSSTLVN